MTTTETAHVLGSFRVNFRDGTSRRFPTIGAARRAKVAHGCATCNLPHAGDHATWCSRSAE